jgi:hypothetical protein
MKRMTQTAIPVTIAALVVVMASCSGDLSKSSSPVTLNVTNAQTISRFDLQQGAANCNQNTTLTVAALLLSSLNNPNLPVDTRFNTVNLTGYTVQYVRRDGGTLVPAPFSRSASGTVQPGSSTALTAVVVEPSALNQAPFAALTPSGGGRDPETGKNTVTMDVIVTVFGETLAGERVSGTTRMTMDFCFACQGCA